jgi:hypothetical protein
MFDPDDHHLLYHLRGVFDRTVLAATLAHYDAIEAERQAIIQSERDASKRRIGAATDALRFDPRWYDLWRDPKLAGVFHPFTWVTFPVQLRHVERPDHLVPWHQDVAYMSLLPRRHARIVTCFIPLELEPARVSTLEFAVDRYEPLAHRPVGDYGAVTAEPPGEKVRFDLVSGDAVVFGDHVPHRSIAAIDGRLDRRSFEFRLVMPDEALADKDYFDITRGLFTRTDGSKREFP